MTAPALTADGLSYVCALVRERAAIELDESKRYLVEARLTSLAKRRGYASTSELVRAVRESRRSDLERALIESMTTNETSFFRDAHPFETLRKTILPELRLKRGDKRTIDVWSAACSTGQELYSIAMVLRETFADLPSWKVSLLGTDLSDEVLDRARAARYSQIEVSRGLSPKALALHFQPVDSQWEVRPELRAMATFKKLNLIEPWVGMPTMDVVFLRNVLIYFSPETKKAILAKVRTVMSPHGVLFLGAAETTLNLDDSFERIRCDGSAYYRLK